jgi:hypothetical protein
MLQFEYTTYCPGEMKTEGRYMDSPGLIVDGWYDLN